MQASDGREKQMDRSDVRWRVTTASGCRFVCTVHSLGGQVEVRLATAEDQLVYAKLVGTIEAAHDVARRWLHAVVANGGAGELGNRPVQKSNLPH